MADSRERLSTIVSLLRRAKPGRFPESLTAAASEGDIAAMEVFLARGANIEERSVGFASPLVAACAARQIESVRWLVTHGAVLDPPQAPLSPVSAALSKGFCDVATVLFDAGLPVGCAAWGASAAAVSISFHCFVAKS